ncbi:cyclic pyranopterin monophosphate synthase MoaC [Roseivirga misakiensis]|uniref:cyclic pyranopterin monophosphate synthase n=1 Tax=Roseivirga misakiensis TaxID=1563681 RepID=A0A1E5SZZ1_9BACT|nr:cyclic pyranopterin monophosphate synthase MoaC [Roseivirga misakiensis]OEK04693.1 molybdenum cofactor biosynthesis protein C [Roseivirga misakiensis]
MTKKFTHIEEESPSMVDVGDKAVTSRSAIAQALVQLPEEMQAYISDGEIKTLKGPVFQTAIVAGIQGAKRTSELIPLCHQLNLNKIDIQINVNDKLEVKVISEARCTGKTGVEMEALTGASVAALTIYDMCKAFSHDIVIKETKLLKKTGGKSDYQV